MKKNILFWLILALGIVVRLLFIDKPAGFWHNEMVMYNQTMAGSITDIINAAVKADVHFPLYQIILAGWIKLFGNGDITIRLFSVLGGVLGIFTAFITGKEIKDEKCGNIFAFLYAINATLIFYSQEVKFYIFLPLFATLSLYFIVRALKSNKYSDYAGYIISNLCIVYTFTIGVLYVAAQGIAVLAYILIKNRDKLKRFLISNLILILLVLPFAFFILTNMGKYEGAAWIFTSNIYTFFVLLQNYFTPCLFAVYNNPEVYYPPAIGLLSLLLWYVPVGIAAYSIYRALKTKNNLFILLITVLFFVFEIILCMNSGLRMLTRYTILALPTLLLLFALGLSELKPKIRNTLIIYLLVINLFYLILSPLSAIRGWRDLGEKPTADFLKENNISDNDVIVLALRKNDFDKYVDFNGGKFSLLQDFVHEPYSMKPNISDKYDAYWDYVKDYNHINKDFENDFVKRVIAPLKPNSKVFYIWDENYNTFPITDYEEYRKIPVMTASLSKMNNEAFYICDKNLKIKSAVKLKYYRVFIFEK